MVCFISFGGSDPRPIEKVGDVAALEINMASTLWPKSDNHFYSPFLPCPHEWVVVRVINFNELGRFCPPTPNTVRE